MSSSADPVKSVAGQLSISADDTAKDALISARRPWHAPRFMLTDIAHTDAQGGITTDAGLGQSGS
jgi:hypothetical protein